MPRLTRPDGVELHWEEQGAGPLVVFANQFFSHPGVFEALLRELAQGHSVVSYDLRGTGDSTRRGPYELATDADDLLALIEALGGPAVVVGIGDGCQRAVIAGAARPDMVTAVVCPGGNPVARSAVQGTEGLAGSSSVIDALVQLAETDYRAALRTIITTANPDMDEDSVRERVNLTAAHCPHEAAAPRLRDWVYGDTSEEARALGDRLWLLEHGLNLWFPIEMAEHTRELLPEAHVEQVPDGPLSRPDLTAEVVRRLTSEEPFPEPRPTGARLS